ncbi:hypothetical protein [Nocardioides sp. Soil805]|uniref:hypothetical protein n=1 Tax=Nocardioides sp. Soil805 TaxID=1736416 RepID=UPI000702C1F1|nr:hypothetical protein [Nocardioides sp. Soil805]KRF37073.1 hypothetical protein ASG94_06775 [Nocardioides sp. Soil805]
MARPTLARRLGAATLLTTLALSTAACGSDSGSEASSGTDASGTSESSDEESPEASGDLEELDAAEFYPSVMEALQDAETFAFTMSSSTEGSDAGSMDMQGVMRYDDDGVDLQATGTGQGADELEMIMLDKVLYMSGVGMDLGGKKWLKIDMSDPDSLFGMLGKSTDPELMFKAMEEPKEFELLGTEEVDGVDTNHYKVVMDTAAYVKAMEMPAELASSMPEDIAVEMWVDADNLPRQFRQELEVPGIAGGEASTSSTEGTYTDYGTDVTIEAPPASEVADKMPGM